MSSKWFPSSKQLQKQKALTVTMELYLSCRQWRIITAIFNLSKTHGWSHILVMTHNTSTAWWLCCCTSNGVWPPKCCNFFFGINLIDAWTYFVMALMGPRLTSFWPTDGKVVLYFSIPPLELPGGSSVLTLLFFTSSYLPNNNCDMNHFRQGGAENKL